MAVVNRTLDKSEARKVYEQNAGATATGVTAVLCTVPYASVLEAGQICAFGVSGSPTVQLQLNRFIVGTGFTTIAVGGANAVVAYGTSGVTSQGMSLNAAGSTLLNFLPNDVLMYQTGGANSAVTGLSVSVVLRPLQDIKTQFGV